MTLSEQIVSVFTDDDKGRLFTRDEIIQKVTKKYNTNKLSVIPSDYCYNRINNDIKRNFDKRVHIFEYINKNEYVYLGVDSEYNGLIYHKSVKSKLRVIGEWRNGEPIFYDSHRSLSNQS